MGTPGDTLLGRDTWGAQRSVVQQFVALGMGTCFFLHPGAAVFIHDGSNQVPTTYIVPFFLTSAAPILLWPESCDRIHITLVFELHSFLSAFQAGILISHGSSGRGPGKGGVRFL